MLWWTTEKPYSRKTEDIMFSFLGISLFVKIEVRRLESWLSGLGALASLLEDPGSIPALI